MFISYTTSVQPSSSRFTVTTLLAAPIEPFSSNTIGPVGMLLSVGSPLPSGSGFAPSCETSDTSSPAGVTPLAVAEFSNGPKFEHGPNSISIHTSPSSQDFKFWPGASNSKSELPSKAVFTANSSLLIPITSKSQPIKVLDKVSRIEILSKSTFPLFSNLIQKPIE